MTLEPSERPLNSQFDLRPSSPPIWERDLSFVDLRPIFGPVEGGVPGLGHGSGLSATGISLDEFLPPPAFQLS